MINYKRVTSVIAIAIAAAVVGLISPSAVDSKIVTNVPSDISSEELMAVVIEDYDKGTIVDKIDDDGWYITSTPKKFPGEDTEKKMKMKNPVPLLELKFIDGKPNDMQFENFSITGMGLKKDKVQMLGLRFKFRYPGTNSVHILPPKEVYWKDRKPVLTYNPSTRKDEQERGIELPGKAKAISMWVHGRGKPYNLEVWVKDWKGATHILQMGSVNYVGWKPLKTYIPSFVPQATETYPQTRVTKITRFVLRADPSAQAEALTEETKVFFDQLKVLTDPFEVNFDGSDLDKAFEGGESKSEQPAKKEQGGKQ